MSFVMNSKGQPAYFHTQETASDTWLIPHGLNKRVVIDVMVNHNGALTKIMPRSILCNDSNTITVMFSKPMTGRAMIS